MVDNAKFRVRQVLFQVVVIGRLYEPAYVLPIQMRQGVCSYLPLVRLFIKCVGFSFVECSQHDRQSRAEDE